jgi:two-component sensor histidine kinase
LNWEEDRSMPAKQTHRARSPAPGDVQSEREVLLRHQKSLAEFGEKALQLDDLDFLLHEGCRLVAAGLDAELSKIMTLEDGGDSILVRSGIGWRDGIVGQLKMVLAEHTADRFALDRREPVIVVDAEQERRFEIAAFVLAEGVQAFVNVPIIVPNDSPPFGILEVDTRKPRQFTADDIAFLKTYANMIAAAVDRQRGNQGLRDLAEQRMQLLHELQHRLKNNLQSVSAFVGMALRSPGGDAAKNVLESLHARVEALKLVQEKIYASGKLDRVELASYLGELSAGLVRFHQTEQMRIGLKSDLVSLTMVPDIAVPLGLIVTEFITNSMKYAFSGGNGIISLQLTTLGNEGCLILADNGKGLGQQQAEGTGMRVIRGLADQLRAAIEWNSDGGTRLSIRFPTKDI